MVTLSVPKASLSRRGSSVKSSTQDSVTQGEPSFKSFIQGLKTLSAERQEEQQKRSRSNKSWISDSYLEHRFSRIVVTVAGIPVRTKHVLLTAILMLTVTGIIAAIIRLTRDEKSAPKTPYCKTRGCLVHAWRLTDKLNTSLDPCHDFSAYVCSAWSPPEGYLEHSNSAMDDVRKSWFPVFEQILKEGSKTLRVGHKALIMYATCMGNSQHYGSNIDIFSKFLSECRLSWPDQPQTYNTSALEVLMTLALKWQVPLFFQVRVQHSAARTNWRLLLEPGSLIPLMYQHHVTIKSTGAYAKYWASFFYILRENYDGNAINHTLVDAVVALEGDVFRRLLVAMHPPVVHPVLVPIAKIGLYTRPLESEHWLHALRQIQLEPEVSYNDTLLIGDENFFQAMAVLISSYKETQLLSLIAWSCVQLLAPAVDLRLLRTRYDQGVILYRPYFCERFVETSYRLLVISLATVSRFSRHERAAVSAKFDHLVTVATGLVNATNWLDTASRQLAAEKLYSTRLQLWPPKIFLRNEELESVYADFPSGELPFAEYWVQSSRRAAETYRARTDIDILSYAVNYALPYLQYDAASSSVKMAVGAVSPPLYYFDGNKAMYYGGLGFFMAVELVASLDRQGLHWHPDGTFGESFLSNTAERAFEDRDGCLEAAEKDPINVPHGSLTRNGSRTSVFPEIPALEVAYATYRQSISVDDDGRPQAMLRNLSGDQVFFMTLCYMTCSLPGAVGPHTVDCNKAVSNSESFARAFQCPHGSKMNPKKKCTFFNS
ncbi:endothelin-converting enzyme 1 [Rhipicephalus microplus]|uniref:endothelin-converting enzyme 1 n=1 Tax=Rhipicephalus microplus TaxID=6941 RepID=UPI003F6C996A